MSFRIGIPVGVAALTLCLASHAAEDQSIEALKGITSVQVLVESLDVGASRIGLTKEAIQTDVELKLRMAGMGVLARGQRAPGNPFLYINVNLNDNASAANVSVALCQDVLLQRTPAIWLTGISTWQQSIVASSPTARDLRESVKDRIDSFLNAWLAANPKTR